MSQSRQDTPMTIEEALEAVVDQAINQVLSTGAIQPQSPAPTTQASAGRENETPREFEPEPDHEQRMEQEPDNNNNTNNSPPPPTTTTTAPEHDPTQCPICYLPLTTPEPTTSCTTCTQPFHLECIREWTQYRNDRPGPFKCPLCRSVWHDQSVDLGAEDDDGGWDGEMDLEGDSDSE